MEERSRLHTILRKIAKVLLWTLGVIIGLLLLCIVIIRIPAVQRKIVHRAQTYLAETLHTNVTIGEVYLSFPKVVRVKNFYVEDLRGDTLLYFDELGVDTDLWGLMNKTIELNTVNIDGLRANIVQNKSDSTFNYQFVIDAFTPDQPDTTTTDSTEAWNFDLKNVTLNNFKIHYDDEAGRLAFGTTCRELSIKMKTFDLNKSILQAKSISIDGAEFNLTTQSVNKQTSGEPSDTTTAIPFDIQVYSFAVTDSRIDIHADDQTFTGDIGEVDLTTDHIDLNQSVINADRFRLSESTFNIQLSPADTTSTAQTSNDTDSGSPWVIRLASLKLDDNQFNMDKGDRDSASHAFNPDHLHLAGLTAEAHELYYSQDSIEAAIDDVVFRSDDFQLASLSAKFLSTSGTMNVTGLDLETGRSKIAGDASAFFGPTLQLNDPETQVKLNLNSTTIALADVLYFYPELEAQLPNAKNMLVKLSTQLSGQLRDLEINHFDLETLQSTSLALRGNIKGLPDLNKLQFEIAPLKVNTSRNDVQAILPDSLMADTTFIPEQIQISANGSGTSKSFNGKIEIGSTSGNIDATVNEFFLQDTIPHYNVVVASKGVNLGPFVNLEEDLNNVGFTLHAKGKGATLNTLASTLSGYISHIEYNQHVYDSLVIDAKVENNLVTGKIGMHDERLSFDFTGDLDREAEDYHYDLKLDLERADLQALNVYRTPLTIAGEVSADIRTKDFKHFNGIIAVRKFEANDSIETYRVDSLLFASISQDTKTEISITSDIMEGSFKGNVDILKLPQAIRQHINNYYAMGVEEKNQYDSMNFVFTLNLKNTDLLTEVLVPDLESITPGLIRAEFDGAKDKLLVDVNIQQLVYSGVTVDTLRLSAISDPEEMKATLSVKGITSANTSVKYLSLSGTLADSSIVTRLAILDSASQIKYLIKGNLHTAESVSRFSLQPDSLILAYEKWTINNDNYIQFGGGKGPSNDILISNNGQRLHIQTPENADSILRVSFTDFTLQSIGKAISKDKDFLGGKVNGSVDVVLPPRNVGASGKLTVDNLEYVGKAWGDLRLEVSHERKNYHADIALKSNQNDVTITGDYTPEQKQVFSVALNIGSLELGTLEPIAAPNVVDLSGVLSGKLTVQGPAKSPVIDGDLHFSEAHFNPKALNNPLYIADESVTFKRSVISFNRFQLEDQKKNTATLSGTVTMKDLSYYELDLRLRTKDFLVLNTTRQKDTPFYGTLRTEGNVRITGTSSRPDIQMTMKVSPGSSLTYEVPKSEYQVLNQANIVEFVNETEPGKPAPEKIAIDTMIFEGITLSAKLEIDNQSTFTIVIDPLTNDQLVVKGDATLNIDMTRKGDMQLAGRYTLSEGKYTFSFYKLVKREFNIQKGSSITWTGDPIEGILDIKATHLVEARPIDLVVNEISTNDSQTLNKYKQRLPILVNLQIKGQLLQPEISFELDMPVDKRNALNGSIYAKLQEVNSHETDLNKQVFALLILQRFVSDNPFQSESGNTLEDNVRRSVSRILSDQLNRLTDDIKGIDLNVDLKSYEDYSRGEAQDQTQLELGVTQNLFNDRLTVKVSGNVNIEGQKQQSVSDYVGDLILEYKMTEDGRLRITGFRKSDYDLLSGEIIETGAGIIFVRDYNAFKELFRKNEPEN